MHHQVRFTRVPNWGGTKRLRCDDRNQLSLYSDPGEPVRGLGARGGWVSERPFKR